MTNSRLGAWLAAVGAAALIASMAQAQTPPADPLAPGAAAEPATSAPAPAKTEAPKEAAPAKPKPKREKSAETGASIAVTVNNKRSVGLVDLTVGPAGDASPKKVAGPLAFGRKTVIHIKRTKDCLYDVRGHFADEADTEQLGVELCKDKVINLTDE